MDRRGFLSGLLGLLAWLMGGAPIPKPKSKWCGRTLELEDTVIYVKREAYQIKFYAYESIGPAGLSFAR